LELQLWKSKSRK